MRQMAAATWTTAREALLGGRLTVVMRPDPRMGALTTVRRRSFGPWWLWTLVVILAAGGGYAGYKLRGAHEEMVRMEDARALLIANRENLQASRQELEQELKRAQKAEEGLRADLDRSRTDGDALAAIVGKLQKRVAALEADLKGAASGKSELQGRVATLERERDLARGEADEARKALAKGDKAKAALEQELASLKDELAKLRAQQAPEATAATPPAP